jgi:hypothetical protein
MTKRLGLLVLGAMSVALALTLALSGHVASVAASSARSGDLHIEKNCSAYTGAPGGYCTITVSNLPEIPANTSKNSLSARRNCPFFFGHQLHRFETAGSGGSSIANATR